MPLPKEAESVPEVDRENWAGGRFEATWLEKTRLGVTSKILRLNTRLRLTSRPLGSGKLLEGAIRRNYSRELSPHLATWRGGQGEGVEGAVTILKSDIHPRLEIHMFEISILNTSLANIISGSAWHHH